MFKIYSSSYIV